MPNKNKIGSLENRIRALCGRVAKSNDEDDLRRMCADLRSLLSEHIELVRDKVRELKAKELESKKRIQ